MPLDVVRLRDSETAVKTKGDEFRCAVLLWCAAWHQVPAASLPDDDALLADLAGFGRVVKEWKRVRAAALRGFVKCSDGRLYHVVVSEKAISSWLSKLQQRWKKDCAKLKKQAERKKLKPNLPDFELWISREHPEAKPYLSSGTDPDCPEDNGGPSPGHPPPVPGKSPPREGKGREGNSKPPSDQRYQGRETPPPEPSALALAEARLNPDTPAATLASICFANGVRVTPFHPLVVDWAREGITPERLREAIATAKMRKGEENIPAAYLDRILEDDPSKSKAKPWKTNDSEAERLCQQLGIKGAKVGESLEAWHRRIETALSEQARKRVA